jgi:predicted RNA-binding Zn ribbon-like protein
MADVTNVAPGDLELVRTFINSWNPEDGVEALTTPAAAGTWLAVKKLLPRDAALGKRELTELIELREALRVLAYANNGGPLDQDARQKVNRFAKRAPVTIALEPDLAPKLAPAERGTNGLIGRLLAIITESIAAGTWTRFKACAADDCHWAFYDHSRNRSGTWCEMSTCGNRAKARSYRDRHQRS